MGRLLSVSEASVGGGLWDVPLGGRVLQVGTHTLTSPGAVRAKTLAVTVAWGIVGSMMSLLLSLWGFGGWGAL